MALQASKPKPASPVAASSFRRVETGEPIRRRLIVLGVGNTKCGSTHFALTAPGPIYYQSLDRGTEGVIERKDRPWAGKEMYVAEYQMDFPADSTDAQVADFAEKQWQRLAANQLVAQQKARTCVIDREGDAWELFRTMRTGRTNPEKQAYMSLSPEYGRYLRSFYDSNCNLIMLERFKDEWKANKPTGNMKIGGFAEAQNIAQVIVEFHKQDGEFWMVVRDCRINPDIEGMAMPNNFATLAATVYGGDESEWQ